VLENTKVRMGTIGKPLQLQGVTVDGSLFDLSEYQGKVVHVVFWSTLDNGFLALELPALINLHNAYQSKGFDIVGVNVDTNVEHTDAFFRAQGKDIPWKTIQAGRSEGDLAKQFGVLMFPYSVLVDANGIVVGNYQDSQNLPADLLAMLGPPATPLLNPDGSPIGGPVPGGPVPGGPVPGGADTEAIEAPAPQADSTDAADPVPDPPADEEDFEELPELALGNPYLARQGMSAMQLVEFILKLEDRPEGLRERPGFKQAVVDAADRVLAGEAPGKLNGIALEKKLQWLHLISMEDDAADEIAAMVKAARPEQDHPRDEVRHWAELIMLEAEALEVDKLPIEKVEPLLNRLGEYFTGATLESRHLRLASSTIHAVNRIDVEKREEFFQSFGKAFQKSKDKKLASYGKKLIGGSSSDSMAELIGRPINVRGQTGLGTPIDWESYRGQFVLVDFWATWCGPCLRAAPDIRAMYDRNHEQGFDVVGINLDRDPDALSKYLDEENPPWLNVVGEDARTLSEELKIRGIPTLLLIGKDGNVLAASHSVSEIAAALKKVLP
jgi:thiol-disulfide isomerase/thioredoxin